MADFEHLADSGSSGGHSGGVGDVGDMGSVGGAGSMGSTPVPQQALQPTPQKRMRYIFNNVGTEPRGSGDDAERIMEYIERNMDDALTYHARTEKSPLVVRDLPGIKNLYVKDESHRMGLMAFKIMGVSYAVHRLEQAGTLKKGSTITTMTDGNHGAAVSYIAKERGLKAVIFVPRNMTTERKERIQKYGADLRIVDGMYDDAIAEVKRQASENGWVLISDTAWSGYETVPKDISTGYCAIFHEAIEYINRNGHCYPTHIFLQAGVGGFPSAGFAYAVSKMVPRPKLICVEPEDADCFLENIGQGCRAGTLMCRGETNSIMSGLNCGLPSTTAWPIMRDYVDLFVAVSDEWAREAVRNLYHSEKSIVVGESGAAGLAGLLACIDCPDTAGGLGLNKDSCVLIVNTEGATDKNIFQQIIGQQVRT